MDDEKPKDTEWKFKKDMFSEQSISVKMLTHYKEVVKKLGRMLYPDRFPIANVELNFPLLKMKLQEIWEPWELDHPKLVRGGFKEASMLILKILDLGKLWRTN